MSQDYKVNAVLGQKEWSGQHGPMISYSLDLEGEEQPAELNQKPTSPPPQAGQTIHGDLSMGNYGWKLKKAQQGGGGFSQGGGGGGKSPEQQRSIVRQHSQEMALRFVAATGSIQELGLEHKEIVGQVLNDQIKPFIDWFEKDAGRGAE